MNVQRVELEPRTIYGVHEVIPMSELTDFFGRALAEAAAEMGKQGAFPGGPPVALYHGMPTDTIDVTAGFPVSRAVAPAGRVVVATLPGGSAVEATHAGPYDTLAETYGEISAWIADQKLTPAEDMFEEYLVGPDGESDPANWRTRIVFPLA
ncbi:GyrI-like domain-containing protein [Lacisediminihabitans profunda]|uniref:GyrI-like domain-containing protein n=1 Tax=Lacisediminihabitans profunda TaxID=2594790 RepID=A0A5C8UW66_9MICO|nr:GyrI-like domain-containing protein [Lacisediminihabitans profunda]TXN31898.1 GyrI-like domain-containing protein [Lacisediminihabitans profunda]